MDTLEDNNHELKRTNQELREQVEELEAIRADLEATTQNLARALEAAAAGNQSKSQFLATMSHELRTPLNAVIGFSEILKDEIFGPIGSARYKDYAASIHQSGAHLLGLINDILDISKFDAGKLELHEEPVDIGHCIAECVRLMEPQAQKAKVSLRTDLPDGALTLKADDRRLRQVLLNLLSNAVKFTPDGGQVTVSATRKDGRLTIACADTGIGIAAKDIPLALERFGQIDSTLSRKYEGTGLGLPLAKHLVELHGGNLAIESEVGTGTTVRIHFPDARVLGKRHAA
jgi:two-component system cell cycle sensor histidine kinase PleC